MILVSAIPWDPFDFPVFAVLTEVEFIFLGGDRHTLSCELDLELLMDGVLGEACFSFDFRSLRCPTFSSVGSVQERSAVNMANDGAKERTAGEALKINLREAARLRFRAERGGSC